MIEFSSIGGGSYGDTWYMHPEVYEKVSKELLEYPQFDLKDLKVITSSYLNKHPLKWEIPPHSLVEYDKVDEEWAKPIKYGQEVPDTSTYLVWLFKDMPETYFQSVHIFPNYNKYIENFQWKLMKPLMLY